MPKRKKLERRNSNPDFRPRNNLPSPPIEEIERRIRLVLTPNSFAAARRRMSDLSLRQRVLTLPVMVAIVLSLVWRRLPSLSELLRVLEREGLFDLTPLRITKQAVSQRWQSLPAELFAQVFNQALEQIEAEQDAKVSLSAAVQAVSEKFPACFVADGSTLEALRKKLKDRTAEGEVVLGGKIMGLIDLYTRRARRAWYSADEKANDKTFCHEIVQFLSEGSLLVFDLGFFSFPFFDKLTEAKSYFMTRLREKTAYQVVEVVSEGKFYRDERIEMGLYRSNPCHHQVRLISVVWGPTWNRYITNVLDAKKLSAREVCELYRHRWRIEEAFLLTKRLLGLSYLWVGSRNGVEIQVYARWLFYAVLTSVCAEVAAALNQPVEHISTEMVFRSFYHYGRAIDMGEHPTLVPFLVKHATLLGLVKAKRKRHKERDKHNQIIWGSLS